jgi:AraC-like DNA-binding protein
VRNYLLIHFVKSGTGTFECPRGKYSVRAGEAFVIYPGEITVYEADSKNPWEYLWIGFSGSLADRFCTLGDVFTYTPDTLHSLEYAIGLECGREEYLTGALFTFYSTIIGSEHCTDHTAKVTAYINAHYMEPVSIAGIADMLGLDRKYLARIFRERVGTSMQKYLITKRLHEGKKLLLNGYTVAEAAAMVGYCDQFAFSKAFKEKYGVAPSACRAQ